MATTRTAAQRSRALNLSGVRAAGTLAGTVFVALLVLYFIGLDQGPPQSSAATPPSTSSCTTPGTCWASPATSRPEIGSPTGALGVGRRR